MVEVSPGLLLGNEGDAMAVLSGAPSITKKHNVTHILTLTREALDLTGTIGVMVDDSKGNDNNGDENEINRDPETLATAEVPSEGVPQEATSVPVADGDVTPPSDVIEKSSEKRILVKFVSMNDMPECDLLHVFEPCCKYIQEGIRSGGTVLVHCVFGISRSSSMVLAYLMWSQGRGYKVLYDELKIKKPDIQPNRGFVEQLELWGAMKCRYDQSNKIYKAYRLKNIAKRMKDGGYTDNMDCLSPDPYTNPMDSKAYYRCRKCRRLLFTDESTLPHNTGQGEAAFKWHKRSNPGPNGASPNQDHNEQGLTHNNDKCSSWFIEPVEWMESSLIGNVEGKVLCPKCNARLGSFNWSGDQCSCGQWVTPSFQIHKSRVDETKTLTKRKPTT